MNQNEKVFKVIIDGAQQTHKSRLFCELLHKQSDCICLFGTETVQFQGVNAKLQIWGSYRQSNTMKFSPLYYKGTGVVLLVFDVGKLETLRMCPIYIQQIRSECSKNTQIMLIGQQFTEIRQVSVDEATVFAEMNKMTYTEVNYIGDQKQSRNLRQDAFVANENTQLQMAQLKRRMAAVAIKSVSSSELMIFVLEIYLLLLLVEWENYIVLLCWYCYLFVENSIINYLSCLIFWSLFLELIQHIIIITANLTFANRLHLTVTNCIQQPKDSQYQLTFI
ncbi:Rab2a [Hexamita inflata]|uniref:Rab2a n=1 Tax=Hexamita inflata TaxID=28002 RepID=A0ABP1HP39_9EUKA